jgi:transposase
MLTQEDDVDAHALHRQGWTISAIARHLDHDRKTIRAYLTGQRSAGVRASAVPDPLGPFLGYLRARFVDDPHVWAVVLFDEITVLGYDRSYPSFTRGLRAHRLRPHCEGCHASTGRDAAIIEHPPGAETQWDWLELPDPPEHWQVGAVAHLLVGALSHSGQWRGVLAEGEDTAHLVDGLHQVSARLGGLSDRWRFDRMATVVNPNTGRLQPGFAAVAKHYAVAVDLCPPRHGNRKGVVEKANHSAAQRWWRTLPDATTMAGAQVSLDAFCARVGDTRTRMRDGAKTTVGALALAEPLGVLPAAFPATLSVTRVVTAQALVAFKGNSYSVPPGLAGTVLTLTHRLGSLTVDVLTSSGTVLARHHRAPDGAGITTRDTAHVTELRTAVLTAFTTDRPCSRKERRPPGDAAVAAAQQLTGTEDSPAGGRDVVIDLASYDRAARSRRSAP